MCVQTDRERQTEGETGQTEITLIRIKHELQQHGQTEGKTTFT